MSITSFARQGLRGHHLSIYLRLLRGHNKVFLLLWNCSGGAATSTIYVAYWPRQWPQRRAKDNLAFLQHRHAANACCGSHFGFSLLLSAAALLWLHQPPTVPGAAVAREKVWSTHNFTLCRVNNRFGWVVLLIAFNLQPRKLPGFN